MQKLKIGIYSPYLNILGGGERYLLTIAKMLSNDYEVFLFSDHALKDKARVTFNISLDKVHFLSNASFKNFHIFFYMTDGSLFFPSAKKNFLIIQSPAHIPKFSLLNRLKLINWNILCYSQYMEKIIKGKLRKSATILPPCINIDRFRSNWREKENIILTVGRFFPYPHNKKHDLLIDVFKKNYQKYFSSWKLIIAGGLTEDSGKKILSDLKRKSTGFPIEILVNIPFSQLVKLYRLSKLYWHAAGFGEDIETHPERAEHFGITTLESMAAGCVPLVYDAGGQKDIVMNDQNGFLWSSEEELVNKTRLLINNTQLLQDLSKRAEKRVQNFSCAKFYEELDKLITG